jgi:regulator of sigma E protease
MPELGFTDLILGFLLLITPVVYFHELGHYWVARKAGVVVDVFSIGFGPEIYGWTAKTGTRWRISAIPLGGYVKMRGDDDAASTPSADGKGVEGSFGNAGLYWRMAIVAGGANCQFHSWHFPFRNCLYGGWQTNSASGDWRCDAKYAGCQRGSKAGR